MTSQVLKIASWNSEGWGSSLVQESRNELLEPQKGLAAAEARMPAELSQERGETEEQEEWELKT